MEQVLGLYRDRYFDLNVRHFHEKLQEQHQIRLSYSWVKAALQGAGLRLHGITTVEEANRFLREHYIAEFNRRFQVAPAQRGTAFVACRRKDLDLIFALQFERTVNHNNTVSFQNLALQIERVRWRGSLAGCTVTLHQHLDGTLSITYGPHPAGTLHRRGRSHHGNKNSGATSCGKDGGRLTKPDISLATKSGHFNLLRTH